MTNAFLHPFARVREDDFITLVSGEGSAVYDDGGRRYVDAMASLWYCNIGHGRAEVVDAISRQLHQLDAFHTFDRFTNPAAEALCAVLADFAPMADARVFLTSGGSEAVDTAIKLVRLAHGAAGETERTIIVSRAPSYHGVTYGGMTVTGLPMNHEHFGPLLPDVVRVGHEDVAALEAVFARDGERIAAVITEPVIAAGGVYPPPAGYLQRVRELCDEHGVLLIMDEVVCGFGRLGAWWGSQRYGVRPDVVTFAKAVTSGYQPLGGVLIGPAVRDRIEAADVWFRHGYTYSGHPAACAAALSVIDITRREGLDQRAVHVGTRLANGLQSLVTDGLLEAVRGDGAVWGAVLEPGLDARAVRDAMLELGVIARPIGANVIAFCPPLVIGDADVDLCHDALSEGVRMVRERTTAAH